MDSRSIRDKKLRQPATNYNATTRRAESSRPANSRRVLIADEDPILLRNLTEAIERDGFSAVPARE